MNVSRLLRSAAAVLVLAACTNVHPREAEPDRDPPRSTSDPTPPPPPSVPPPASPTAGATGPLPYLVIQNHYARDPVETLGVSNRAVCVNGSVFCASNRTTFRQFMDATEQDVQATIRDYFRKHPHVRRETSDIVIIDIEHPVPIMGLGEHLRNRLNFAQVVEAFRMRYRVARQMMPNARLAQYGFIPDPRGDASGQKFVKGLEGVREAARLGMFDDLDLICPVLYLRYGASDSNYKTIPAYTRLGLDAFKDLKRSDGTKLELFPLLSFRVFNGRSKDKRVLAANFDPKLEKTLALQVRIIRESGVRQFGFWNERPVFNYGNPRALTIMEVLATALGKEAESTAQ